MINKLGKGESFFRGVTPCYTCEDWCALAWCDNTELRRFLWTTCSSLGLGPIAMVIPSPTKGLWDSWSSLSLISLFLHLVFHVLSFLVEGDSELKWQCNALSRRERVSSETLFSSCLGPHSSHSQWGGLNNEPGNRHSQISGMHTPETARTSACNLGYCG